MANRKASMTDAERIKALLRREKPDRVPIMPFGGAVAFCGVDNGLTIAEVYNEPEKTLEAERKTYEKYGWAFMPYLAYASCGAWEFGGDVKWPRGQFDMAPSVSRRPVETEEDAWKLKMPKDVSQAGMIPIQTEFFKLAAEMFKKNRPDNQPFIGLPPGGGAFTLAGNICGPDTLCKWLIKKPNAARHLIEMASDYLIMISEYWKGLFGTGDILMLNAAEASTANELISPKQFEEFVLPYDKKLAEVMLKMGYKHIYTHICGEQNLNLPYWEQINFGDPGIISFGHEIKLATMARHFPRDIILGNLEPAIIQVRTAAEVYEAAKKNIEDGKALSNGYIFSPGCALPPRAPAENVMALTRAANDVGWYD